MRRTHWPGIVLLLSIASLSAGEKTTEGQQKPVPIKASAIQVLKAESTEVKLPPDFEMALYENLISEVVKTGKFQHVYRDGDTAAAEAPDLVLLRLTLLGFKEGSARARQVTTVAGATSIKVHAQFVTRNGQTLLERDIEGKVRFFGENLRATYNLSKAVAKVVRENF